MADSMRKVHERGHAAFLVYGIVKAIRDKCSRHQSFLCCFNSCAATDSTTMARKVKAVLADDDSRVNSPGRTITEISDVTEDEAIPVLASSRARSATPQAGAARKLRGSRAYGGLKKNKVIEDSDENDSPTASTPMDKFINFPERKGGKVKKLDEHSDSDSDFTPIEGNATNIEEKVTTSTPKKPKTGLFPSEPKAKAFLKLVTLPDTLEESKREACLQLTALMFEKNPTQAFATPVAGALVDMINNNPSVGLADDLLDVTSALAQRRSIANAPEDSRQKLIAWVMCQPDPLSHKSASVVSLLWDVVPDDVKATLMNPEVEVSPFVAYSIVPRLLDHWVEFSSPIGISRIVKVLTVALMETRWNSVELLERYGHKVPQLLWSAIKDSLTAVTAPTEPAVPSTTPKIVPTGVAAAPRSGESVGTIRVQPPVLDESAPRVTSLTPVATPLGPTATTRNPFTNMLADRASSPIPPSPLPEEITSKSDREHIQDSQHTSEDNAKLTKRSASVQDSEYQIKRAREEPPRAFRGFCDTITSSKFYFIMADHRKLEELFGQLYGGDNDNDAISDLH